MRVAPGWQQGNDGLSSRAWRNWIWPTTGSRFFPRASRKKHSRHLNFSLVRQPSQAKLDFWPTEPCGKKRVLIQASKFVVICYAAKGNSDIISRCNMFESHWTALTVLSKPPVRGPHHWPPWLPREQVTLVLLSPFALPTSRSARVWRICWHPGRRQPSLLFCVSRWGVSGHSAPWSSPWPESASRAPSQLCRCLSSAGTSLVTRKQVRWCVTLITYWNLACTFDSLLQKVT